MQADRPGQGAKLKRCRHGSETPRDREPRHRQDHRDFQQEAEVPVGGQIGSNKIEDDLAGREAGRQHRGTGVAGPPIPLPVAATLPVRAP